MTLEATQIGIWDWDVANERYYASPIYYTMLGYEPNEGPADRSEWVRRLHPDDEKAVLEQVDKVLSRTCDEYACEARFRHADGSYKWQWAFGYAAGLDQDGKLTRMLGLHIDIDKRKRMEEELSTYRGHLEELVRERTAELEAANKELNAFAYSVSHDLRAPLRHIDGFLELLQKKAQAALDDQSRHYMDTISDSAKKMGLLIDDLLSFSRMGRYEMSFQQVDLGSLTREVIRELAPDAAGRDIEWRIGDLPTVGGDAAMLRIALVNLLANALKFTRPRQQAQIEIGSLSGQGSEAVIFVRDNGVGFDMTYVDKLFGVFQRLHRAEEFEGTGIGLANVRRIIARHGGRTWAEGEPDHGAAFFLSLPHTL
jgi:PAS domain S-box-containing protein